MFYRTPSASSTCALPPSPRRATWTPPRMVPIAAPVAAPASLPRPLRSYMPSRPSKSCMPVTTSRAAPPIANALDGVLKNDLPASAPWRSNDFSRPHGSTVRLAVSVLRRSEQQISKITAKTPANLPGSVLFLARPARRNINVIIIRRVKHVVWRMMVSSDTVSLICLHRIQFCMS